ncbi:hypothetical protein KR044_007740, partial [Drosophila immigrans]
LKEQQHQGDSQLVNSFWTCDELMECLPQVRQLRQIFDLFVRLSGCNSIDVLKVPECLHAMGLRSGNATLRASLGERLLHFPLDKPPTRVSFELVLMLYSELADEVPTASVMVNGIRSCDGQSTGVLPLAKIRHMLTSLGRRLTAESEICEQLEALKDDKGNVNYVLLMETMFAADMQAVHKLREVRLYLDAVGKNASHMDMHKRDEFIATLRHLDPNCSGYIAADQLIQLLNANGDRFTIAELATLTRGMTNCKKQVDYRLFLRLIMNE